jgi:hypothetical protein
MHVVFGRRHRIGVFSDASGGGAHGVSVNGIRWLPVSSQLSRQILQGKLSTKVLTASGNRERRQFPVAKGFQSDDAAGAGRNSAA